MRGWGFIVVTLAITLALMWCDLNLLEGTEVAVVILTHDQMFWILWGMFLFGAGAMAFVVWVASRRP